MLGLRLNINRQNIVSGTPDVVAPTLQSAVITDANRDKVVLTYDEALNESDVPTYTIPGKTVSGAVVSGVTVTVTVTVAFNSWDTVTISSSGTTLKDLAGNAAAALSGQAVTNQIIFAPSEITGLTLHLDAALGVTTVEDSGTRVQAWADQSGNGNNVSAVASTNRPYYVTGQNSLPAVSITSTLHYLKTAGNFPITGSTARTILLVAKRTTATGANYFFTWGTATGAGKFWAFTHEYFIRCDSTVRGFVDASISGVAEVLNISLSGTNLNSTTFRRNSVTKTETSCTSCTTTIDTAVGPLYIGGVSSPLSSISEISEILIWNKALSTAERDAIESYLTVKFAI